MENFKLKDRPFESWHIDRYRALSPDGKYRFWIASGLIFFRDDGGEEQLLNLLSFWQKWKVWRALKKEMEMRVSELLSPQPNRDKEI